MCLKSERVYRTILNRIMSGELSLGESVPERAIAAELNVGRTPVREAVQRLQQEGLIEFRPPRGRVVRLWSPEDVRARYQMRFAVESVAIEWAVQAMTPPIHRRLIAFCDRSEALVRDGGDGERIEEAMNLDIRFHETLIEASGNKEIIREASLFHLAGSIFATPEDLVFEDLAVATRDHRRIAECLLKKDVPGALAVLKTHLQRSAEEAALWIEKRIIEGVHALV